MMCRPALGAEGAAGDHRRAGLPGRDRATVHGLRLAGLRSVGDLDLGAAEAGLDRAADEAALRALRRTNRPAASLKEIASSA
jgi:hypothetical protein